MPYRNDPFVKDCFYHIYNRGLSRAEIFHKVRDYRKFTEKLAEYLEITGHELHGYCLMPNHFHLLIKQTSDEPLNLFLGRLQNSYGKYLNEKYHRKGNVFEGRFKAKLIDSDEYLLQVGKYIHRNPLEAGLVKKLLEYPWNSYWSYVGEVGEIFVKTSFVLDYFSNRKGRQQDYREYVEGNFDESEILVLAKELIDVED